MAYFFFKNFRNQTRWLNRNIWFQFDQTRFYSNFTTDFVSRFCLKIICISLIDILGTIHRIIYYLKISEIECDWVEGEKIWFRFVRKGNKKIKWGNDWFRKQGFFIHRSIKYRTCDNTIRKNLYVTWPFIIFSWRGGREGGNAQQLQQSTVEILKCEVPMKRARNILSQRMPLNEVNLFWTRPIFSFGTLFSSLPLNAKVSQLSFQYPASPTTINNSTIQISRIYYPFVNYTKGGGIEKPEPIRSIQCSANIESKTRKNRNRVLTR